MIPPCDAFFKFATPLTNSPRSPRAHATSGKSTVFDYDATTGFCEEGETLALRFRQAMTLGRDDRLTYSQLRANGVVRGAPMTIQTVAGGEQWLSAMTGLLY